MPSKLFANVTLLLADPGKRFPQDFDPASPFKTRVLQLVTQAAFPNQISRCDGEAVVPLEKWDPGSDVVVVPELAALYDGAKFIVVPKLSQLGSLKEQVGAVI